MPLRKRRLRSKSICGTLLVAPSSRSLRARLPGAKDPSLGIELHDCARQRFAIGPDQIFRGFYGLVIDASEIFLNVSPPAGRSQLLEGPILAQGGRETAPKRVSASTLLYTGGSTTMQTKHSIGVLGATGMVAQRFIQLLENHPWFQITWLAASDRSSGKKYGDAAKWRLDTACPEGIAKMTISPADPDGSPKIIFAALDTDIARELEPKFAAAGCAVVSNSGAFRMHPNVPLVIPEVNADHLHLIEGQTWRKESGGYIVTNPNCSAIGLVMALKPIEERFGIEQIFVTTMQAISGAGYPGVPSMDILGNVVPYIKSEEEKMEVETLKLLGRLDGHAVTPLEARMSAHCNRVAVEDGHTESVSIKLARPATKEQMLAAWAEFKPLAGQDL